MLSQLLRAGFPAADATCFWATEFSLAFQPIHASLTAYREVRIPADLALEKRADFIKRVESAVKKQAALAEQSDSILRFTGTVREEGDLLRIEHEPASPLHLRQILDADEHPDVQTLWWITGHALRAFAAAETKRLVHGGVQPRCLLMDRIGRIKVADFGLPSAFEALCGREERRYIVCEPVCEKEPQSATSARWMQMNEDSEREDSWIAPFFAPEILAGGTLLNSPADQFSLGVTLYLLATGVHPLGAELSNPELFGYFVPEPYPFEDERKDWEEAFERQTAQAALSADQAVLDWAALVYRLLANETGERFPNFAAALEQARKHTPDEWTEAQRVLGESIDLLDQGQYDAFLTAIGPWSENPRLPPLWRQRLAECIAEAEQIKAQAAARAAVESKLHAGYAALDGGNLEQARAVADEVASGLNSDDPLYGRIEELRRLCDEYEQNIRQKADELFQANVALARETLARGEFTEARLILTGLLDDPLTGPEHAGEIEELLAELDRQARHFAHFQEQFDRIKADFAEGKLSGALELLEQLLAEPDIPMQLRDPIEAFTRDLEAEKRRHEEHLATIRAVEEALELGDAATAEETLAMLPFDTQDPHLIARRDELTTACETLRGFLQRLAVLEQQLNAGEAEAALAGVEALLREKPPKVVGERTSELTLRCRKVIEQLQKAQIGDALEALTLAETAFETGDVVQCRRQLRSVLPFTARLETKDRARASELEQAVSRCENAQQLLEAAERRLGQADFDGAEETLAKIATGDLPAKFAGKPADLREKIQTARAAYREQRLARLREWLEQIADHLERNEIKQAEELLDREQPPADVDEELNRRYEMLRADALRGRKILEAFAPLEKALLAGKIEEAAELLDNTRAEESDWPAWAVERAAQYRERLDKSAAERREQVAREVEAELQQAAAELERGDAEAAKRRLVGVEAKLRFVEQSRPRFEELRQAIDELERWLPKIADFERAAQTEPPIEILPRASELLGQPLPQTLRPRVDAAEKTIHARIAQRRAELTQNLENAKREIEQRGRRARSIPRLLAAIRDDALATQEQQADAAALSARFDALPQPKGRGLPIAVAAAVIVVGLGAGWFLTRGGDTPSMPEPTPVVRDEPPIVPPAQTPSAGEILKAATARLHEALEQVLNLLPDDRRGYSWDLVFDPPDAFDTSLRAVDASGRVLILAERLSQAEVGTLQWNASWTERLFPPPAVVETPAAEPSTPEPTPGHEPAPEPLPAEPAWPRVLATGATERPGVDFLKELLETIAPPSASAGAYPTLPILAGIVERVTLGERDAENAVAVTFELANAAGVVAETFPLQARGRMWVPDEDNAVILGSALRNIVERLETRYANLADDIERQYLTGELTAAYESARQARGAPNPREIREIADALERMTSVLRRLPPAWSLPEGYRASEESDPDTGYPLAITNEGRTLLLVNVPPNDPLWANLAAAPAAATASENAAIEILRSEAGMRPLDRRWRIYYIMSNNPTVPVNDDPRTAARSLPACDLPGVDEWLLAALKLRDRNAAFGFFGGLWEWCQAGDQLWVSGGCDALHGRFLPWPSDLSQFSTAWDWLTHPLVLQPRRWGDDLAGVRPVLVPR